MKKIERLTPKQEAELPRFRERYLDIAFGGGRIDRPALESALAEAYNEIGRSPPKLLIFESPTMCMMALRVLALSNDRQLGDQLWGQLWGQLWDQLWDQLGDQLRGQLGGQLGGQLWDQLRDQLWGQLWDQLWGQLGDQLRGQLGDQLWDQLWDQLGDQLGDQLWGQLGGQSIWNPNFLLGSQDLYWIAWGRFAENIGVKLKLDTARSLDIMERISTQCEWWWPHENVVVASQRPISVKWDDEKRLHCETSKAVEYADGTGISCWHGQAIPDEWVAGSPPKPAEALHWPNMDQRAAACEIAGWANILDELDAKTIDDSRDPVWGRLVEVTLPDSGSERFLDAMCGTGRRFALPVPPKTKSVDEAQSVLHGGLPAEILRFSVERT